MIQWVKPSGTIVETNEKQSSIAAAEFLGWVRKSELDKMQAEKEPKPKKRGRKPSNGESSEGN